MEVRVMTEILLMPLVTLEEVKDYLDSMGVPLEADIYDSLIEDEIIPSVSAEINGYCSRDFGEKERTEYYNGGTEFVFVKNPPIVTLSSIYVDDDYSWGEDYLIEAGDYLVIEQNKILYKEGKWQSGEAIIKVTYLGGYIYPAPVPLGTHIELPKEVHNAALIQCAYNFKRRKDLGLASVSYPDGQIQKYETGNLLKEVRDKLIPYDLTPIAT
jgi:hypothetical protein